MSYKIKENDVQQVEVREIKVGEYFEFHGEVYQRYGVASNFAIVAKTSCSYPIYAICLDTATVCYFSSDGKTMVLPLYEISPLTLARQRP